MNELALTPEKDFGDYMAAVSRRRGPMLMTALVLLALSAIVGLVLPPVYRSTATILIEEQEIPQDLVRSTISSYADQRIQVISQQVMTRANLMKVVDKYGLYSAKRRSLTTEEIIEQMRKGIKLDVVTADVIDRRSGSKTTATIAFTLSFESDSPDLAQKGANELASLYLNENLQIRQQKVAETSTFLGEEANRLRAHIAEIEGRLSEFKARNVGRLPELAQVNMQMRDRADQEMLEIDRQLSSLEERRIYLGAQLAQIKPNTPILSATGERILDPEERLKSLRAQFAGMSGVYSDRHPDMVRMRKQIEALESETETVADGSEEGKQLQKLQGELASVEKRYAEDHPDVQRLRKAIDALRSRIATADVVRSTLSKQKPENPAFLAFQSQLDASESERRALLKKKAEMQSRYNQLEARIEKTPEVERDYLEMSRDRDNSVLRYREIAAKLMEAQVAQELEKDRKSERFSLIDPPQIPEKPRSPNRPLILLFGLIFALAGGAATVGVLESLDKSVRNSRDLADTLSMPILSAIPYIANEHDRRRVAGRMRLALAAIVLLMIAIPLAIHLLWMPLDVLWFALLRRLHIS